jgi:hypothetical protein
MLDRLRGRSRRSPRHVTWDDDSLPERLLGLPSMLTVGERALLYSLGRELRDETCIVDAGCFLGGSTAALALGVSERLRPPRTVIHSYDLFLVDYSAQTHYRELIGERALGADLLPVFETVVGDDLIGYVDVHRGDLLAQSWPGDPIDVLFVDVAKSWALCDHVGQEFFPSLVPGRSVVVQQDYVHEWLPWIHITMELLGDYFERVATVPGSPSVVFGCTRKIRPSDLPGALRDLPDERLDELFDRAVAPYTGEDRTILECARAVLLAELHGPDRALVHLDELAARTTEPTQRFTTVWEQVRGWAASLPS